MDPVEGSTELNESLDTTTEPPLIKIKENDQPLQQPESCNVALEIPATIHTPESAWAQHLSMEILAGRDVNFIPGLQSRPEAHHTGPHLVNDPGVMVEQLTLKNYKIPHRPVSGCSSSGEPAQKGLWHNFRSITGGARDALYKGASATGDRDISPMLLPHLWVQRSLPSMQTDQYYSKVSDHIALSENHMVSANLRLPSGIRTKVLPSSGFAQFLVKTTFKGKGVAYSHQGLANVHGKMIQDQNIEGHAGKVKNASDTLQGTSEKPKDGSPVVVGGGFGVTGLHEDGINLREWLKPRQQKLNKTERLHIFKKILELVDNSHSKGHALQNLRPSYFMIFPSNQIKYIGSFSPECQIKLSSDPINQNVEHQPKRKSYLEKGEDKHLLSPKQLKHSERSYIGTRCYSIRGASKGDNIQESDAGKFGSNFRELKLSESYKPQTTHFNPILSTAGSQQSIPEIVKLEDRWYASPEEQNQSTCPFAANIYSLGVLLFELFCYFESWEAHSSAMLDLHYRILPPNFLSESPKEAGFCFWLLHPEPSSRPKSRDILVCDLISEGRDLSSLEHSSALIDEQNAEAELLLDFLLMLKEQKEKQAEKLVANLGCLNSDIEKVERQVSSRGPLGNEDSHTLTDIPDVNPNEGNNLEADSRLPMPNKNGERLIRNIDQLENAYFSIRANIEVLETGVAIRSDQDILRICDNWSRSQNDGNVWNPNIESSDCLGAFFEGLCKYARYNKFEVCGGLRNVDILNSANVICSLGFDRDEDYFAAAGVSKKIKIFEFGALLNDSVDIHYPVIEMSSQSKLSCVCWNSYIKNYLASTDYEGVIQLWDASTGQGFTQYLEHQKRAWSVDFSQVDPTKLASGSDDCCVKLWSINEKHCIDTIRNVANVCCVQFSSHSSHLLAFGSADYKVYCYDLRNTRIPWCTLVGHSKAVSYVKFVDPETLVSASTDNTLKIWDLRKTSSTGLSTNACSMTLSGHTNEKNFVGLSVSDGYIACGSETNEVYAYYKTLPMPITAHKFGSIDPITGQETGDDNGQFVSSVCWRSRSNMVVTANSSGSIKLLQMV